MKILQVIDTLNVGGAEKMCVQLANLMKENGHEVGVLYFDHSDFNLVSQIEKGVELIYVNKNILNPYYYYKIYKVIKSFDIVHVHMRSGLKIIYLSTLFGYLYNKVVFHDHTGGNDQFINSSKGLLIYKSIRRFKYVAVYNYLSEKSILKFNLRPESTSVISNFITLPNEIKFRKSNFDLNRLDILVVGNFRKEKNQEFLLEISQELSKRNGINFHFHIIGELQKNNYYSDFIEKVYSMNLKKHFIIYNDVNNLFVFGHQINFAMMPSLEESGPLVLIEYLILKLPFLANNVGDVTNIINAYLPSQILNELNAKLWVDRLFKINFIDNLNLYQTVYNTEFSKEIAYSKWLDIYEEVLN
jgi:glycosyltransferase involved in cell wall biosynthesis